jgi:hypothetical protein
MEHQPQEIRISSEPGEHREKKAPKITQSGHGKSLKYDIEPAEVLQLVSVFGTAEPDFASLMLSAIIDAGADGNPSRPPGYEHINRALAAVTGIGAQDEIEGMLATQMVITHIAAVSALRRLNGSQTVSVQDSNGNLAVKLLRTFTMQVEALQRYRGKGQQKVTVEHVHVHAGGQAIVGAVHPQPGEELKEQADAPRGITHTPNAPLRGSDPERERLSITSSARKAPL